MKTREARGRIAIRVDDNDRYMVEVCYQMLLALPLDLRRVFRRGEANLLLFFLWNRKLETALDL